ncbi:RadC family protein [Chitiniphilus eburneus]|uniref:JAB domain-containing protein n=1 Tax=Chitiniphilus eburneus TaxID=2571148 RepID=A0A4U0PE83_9NEIS|nr:DNA repair protein RadC [Chitiniphilus eburneus]TJZ66125.1 JAB domain-containing protein [Chitiniphilus eburneus]
MPITDWPDTERPRERLLHHGAHALSDAELLAVLLRVGIPGQNAVELGRMLIQRFGSLNGVFSAPQREFVAMPGMGRAKYLQMQAVLEIVTRMAREPLHKTNALNSPQEVRNYLSHWLRRSEIEVFVALFLDNANQVISSEQLAHGTVSETRVYPREVARRALAHNASAVIVAHNHPSGRATPSEADIRLTHLLRTALELLEIRLLDHFIVAGHEVASLAEMGRI